MLYDLLFIIFAIAYLPYFLFSGKWRGFSRQRLSIFPRDIRAKIAGSEAIWLHAVSVGEVIATIPLYEGLRKDFPGEKIIVSTVTPTGNKIARERFKDAAAVIYLPLDLSGITDKVVKLIKPKMALIAETEIWPNFIRSLNENGAKVVIFNGRVSPGSFKNYAMVKPFLKGVLEKVTLFLMQSRADADKIISLGAPEEKVKVTGNLKYDAALMEAETEEGGALRKEMGLGGPEKLLVAGSTHPGEEEALLCSYKELTAEFPDLRLLIAPRHVERAGVIAGHAQNHSLAARLVSKAGSAALSKDEVVILDVMGRLSRIYASADLVFIGGSLIKKGGQNPLEPAFHSKAVLFGPYMYNFETIATDLISAGGAVMVKDAAGLTASLRALLKDDPGRRRMGEAARRVLESNAGAAKKDLALIEPLIKR